MTDNDTSFTGFKWPKPTLTWIECQSCGEPVEVLVPFIGCVYCQDCSTPISIGTEDFTPKY